MSLHGSDIRVAANALAKAIESLGFSIERAAKTLAESNKETHER